MKYRILVAFSLLFTTAMISCSKSNDGSKPAEFQPITFKFGPDATAITIGQASQTVKNLPRGCDATQLTATVDMPAGFLISPDPTVAKDYTNGVTYTVTNAQGKTYTVQITVPKYDAANNPWGIYTPKQLNNIRNGLNDSYALMNDIELPALNASNAAALVGVSDYATNGWYSIGSRFVNGGNVIFRGSLDGQNHVIKNLTSLYRGDSAPTGMDAGHNGKSYDGLFGYAISASFKNLSIQLASTGISDFLASGDGYGATAALVGRADSCTIVNCAVSGSAAIASSQYTGGIVGQAFICNFSKCSSALTSTPAAAITSGSYAGGLLGWAYQTQITDCYSSSSVSGSVEIGGLVGLANSCTIKTSYASGNVSETPSAGGSLIASNSLGGLVGTATSVSPLTTTIENCYATGAVSGANGSSVSFHQSSRIGGLIGQITGTSGPVSVRFCYASGIVSRVYTSSTAPFLIGGLVGTTANNVFITSSTCSNYWDKEKTGQTKLGGGDGTLATDNAYMQNGKASTEMKTQSTYLNWDFSGVWAMSSTSNNGYPTLRSIK